MQGYKRLNARALSQIRPGGILFTFSCSQAVSKELFHWTDTYVIDVADEENALYALMVVLAIDAEKCSRN